jgi:glyoxylase-like metal-dependent hydrolase (beta-lactamase superfamily II)
VEAPNVTTAAGTGGAGFGFELVAPAPTRLLDDGDVIEAGELRLTVLHTPGHTPGGICLLAEDFGEDVHLFAGDTLFAGSVGRTDFPGGDPRALARSIAEKLEPLAGATIVHPGHGPDTTIARERHSNFFWPRTVR